MRLIYSILLTLLLPLLVLRLLLRSRKAPAYRRRLGERLGFFAPPPADRPLLWVHAVSLGEVLAARPLIERLLRELPACRVAVTTTTPTGSAQLRRLFGERVFHVYAPWDTPGAVRRCLSRLQPALLLLMETELWPNLLHHCRLRGCPVVLANARLSRRSARGYARVAGTTRQMLRSLALIAAQDRQSAARFVALGAPVERIAVTGSVKFDVDIDAGLRAQAERLAAQWSLDGRPVIIAGSTHDGEEALLLEAFAAVRERQPTALLIVVPRHPERFDAVSGLCRASGWTVVRRSGGGGVDAHTDVLVVDSIGELLLFYGIADIAIVGGSFPSAGRGGHNPLEPAAWGKPVISGPCMVNFAQIAAQLLDAGGLEQVRDAPALAARLLSLCADAGERERRGVAARGVVEASCGALDALFSEVRGILRPVCDQA